MMGATLERSWQRPPCAGAGLEGRLRGGARLGHKSGLDWAAQVDLLAKDIHKRYLGLYIVARDETETWHECQDETTTKRI